MWSREPRAERRGPRAGETTGLMDESMCIQCGSAFQKQNTKHIAWDNGGKADGRQSTCATLRPEPHPRRALHRGPIGGVGPREVDERPVALRLDRAQRRVVPPLPPTGHGQALVRLARAVQKRLCKSSLRKAQWHSGDRAAHRVRAVAAAPPHLHLGARLQRAQVQLLPREVRRFGVVRADGRRRRCASRLIAAVYASQAASISSAARATQWRGGGAVGRGSGCAPRTRLMEAPRRSRTTAHCPRGARSVLRSQAPWLKAGGNYQAARVRHASPGPSRTPAGCSRPSRRAPEHRTLVLREA